jgi:hypothetical protein
VLLAIAADVTRAVAILRMLVQRLDDSGKRRRSVR